VVSAFLFAQDLLDEGVATVLDRLSYGGLNGATMAVAYHHGRDVFPHNPKHTIVYHEGGTVYFHPQAGRYAKASLQPRIARIASDVDPLAQLTNAAAARGMHVGAWAALLHNSRLASNHPDCAPVNAFGDPMLNYLCPAHPAARAYACAIVADIARYGVRSIELEALSYQPFDHGYHHERSFIRLSPNIRFLLGLCFCPHCLTAARRAGIDGALVRNHVRTRVEHVLKSAANETWEPDIQEEQLRSEAQGELGRFLDVRQQTVASLVEEVTAAAHEASPTARVVFLELSGGVLGYATGRPATEQQATSLAWRDGVDILAVARACDGIGVLAYFAEPDRLDREIAAYQRTVPTGKGLEVLLRPMLPDAESPAALAMKVASLRRSGITDISFYHYGFMRLESLDWIRAALSADYAASSAGRPPRHHSREE